MYNVFRHLYKIDRDYFVISYSRLNWNRTKFCHLQTMMNPFTIRKNWSRFVVKMAVVAVSLVAVTLVAITVSLVAISVSLVAILLLKLKSALSFRDDVSPTTVRS